MGTPVPDVVVYVADDQACRAQGGATEATRTSSEVRICKTTASLSADSWG